MVDATQGIEAQTMANFYLALEHDLEIIPVVNKIDLPAAEPEKVLAEIETAFGIPKEDCLNAQKIIIKHNRETKKRESKFWEAT